MIFADPILPHPPQDPSATSPVSVSPALYERMEHWQELKHQMGLVRLAGAVADHDRKAGTVEATFGKDLLFRAHYQGQATWLVEYSEAFYPRETAPAARCAA
jgi:hypothetical protein